MAGLDLGWGLTRTQVSGAAGVQQLRLTLYGVHTTKPNTEISYQVILFLVLDCICLVLAYITNYECSQPYVYIRRTHYPSVYGIVLCRNIDTRYVTT